MMRRTFTYAQLLGLLEEAGVQRVSRDSATGRLRISVADASARAEMTMPEFKSRFVGKLKDLEDRRLEIMENRFAQPIVSEVAVGAYANVRMRFLKRDSQLTAHERADKRALLAAIDKEMRAARIMIAGLNHLQVHAASFTLPMSITAPALEHGPGVAAGGRSVWRKGITSAALHCRNELRRGDSAGRSALDVCRDFLARYAIQEEPDYTPEQLQNNVLQLQVIERNF